MNQQPLSSHYRLIRTYGSLFVLGVHLLGYLAVA